MSDKVNNAAVQGKLALHLDNVMSMTPWQCAEALAYWERRARDAEEERNTLQQDLYQLIQGNAEIENG